MTETAHLQITDAMVAALRAQIGVESSPHNPWHEAATFDAIRHYAWGIGDDNPLWTDPAYAAGSPWGGVIAPPTFLSTTNHGPRGPGVPPKPAPGLAGIHGFRVSDTWEFLTPTREGDRIAVSEYLAGVEDRFSRSRGRMVYQQREARYVNQVGTVLARHNRLTVSHERGVARADERYADINRWVYSDDELAMIDWDYEGEIRRGAEPRYWEDVEVGEEIGHVVKGPLTVLALLTYFMGWGMAYGMTDKIARDYRRLHPHDVFPHPDTNVPDFQDRAHWGDPLVHELGFPLGYDIGAQRIAWFAHALTNWHGDHGFLRSLRVSLLSPNWLGDTTWIRGRVTDKHMQGREPLVSIDLWGENQRRDRHSQASATVRLPSRDK
ncbi:MAG: MaoC family dehydratase N-terminal domain-containing protein [Dehalococcoidia bacterium]